MGPLRAPARGAALSAALLALACAGGPPHLQTGPDAEVTHDGLHRLEHTSFDRAWARPGLDLSGYRRILLVSDGIHYKRPPAAGRALAFALAPFEREALETELRTAFVQALFDDGAWRVAEVAAPEALLLRVALIDVVVSAPPEPSSSRDDVLIDSAGSAVLVLELHDSVTREALARVADHGDFEPVGAELMQSNSINNRAEIRRTFRAWASLLRRRLDELRTLKVSPAAQPPAFTRSRIQPTITPYMPSIACAACASDTPSGSKLALQSSSLAAPFSRTRSVAR